jgi:D-alanine-D-alanine ligase-like ATP-grasp enzyme
MKYIPTFENFDSQNNPYNKIKKPVLFLNFSFTCGDMYGKEYNVENLMKQYIDIAEYSELDNISYFDGAVYNEKNKLDAYSLIFMWPSNEKYENFKLVQDYCKLKNIPLLPRGTYNYDSTNDKYKQLLKLNSEGLKIPKTYTFLNGHCDVNLASSEFSYPLILKAAHGSHGDKVSIIKSKSELIKVLKSTKDESLMIQEFIPNDCDYRVMFIGNRHVFSAKRSRDKKNKDEFRNNISLGATGERINLSAEVMNIAERAHNCMGFYTSGVDLIQNKETGEWFVLEVNWSPNFGIFGPEFVIKMLAEDINILRK